jgi:hypothetical protein
MVSIDRSADKAWFSGLDALRWASATGVREPRPEDVSGVGDETSAAAALREVERGRYVIYRGHYSNALQLLAAMHLRLSDEARLGVRERAPSSPDTFKMPEVCVVETDPETTEIVVLAAHRPTTAGGL